MLVLVGWLVGWLFRSFVSVDVAGLELFNIWACKSIVEICANHARATSPTNDCKVDRSRKENEPIFYIIVPPTNSERLDCSCSVSLTMNMSDCFVRVRMFMSVLCVCVCTTAQIISYIEEYSPIKCNACLIYIVRFVSSLNPSHRDKSKQRRPWTHSQVHSTYCKSIAS